MPGGVHRGRRGAPSAACRPAPGVRPSVRGWRGPCLAHKEGDVGDVYPHFDQLPPGGAGRAVQPTHAERVVHVGAARRVDAGDGGGGAGTALHVSSGRARRRAPGHAWQRTSGRVPRAACGQPCSAVQGGPAPRTCTRGTRALAGRAAPPAQRAASRTRRCSAPAAAPSAHPRCMHEGRGGGRRDVAQIAAGLARSTTTTQVVTGEASTRSAKQHAERDGQRVLSAVRMHWRPRMRPAPEGLPVHAAADQHAVRLAPDVAGEAANGSQLGQGGNMRDTEQQGLLLPASSRGRSPRKQHGAAGRQRGAGRAAGSSWAWGTMPTVASPPPRQVTGSRGKLAAHRGCHSTQPAALRLPAAYLREFMGPRARTRWPWG